MAFRAFREVGRQVRDSLADSIQQQQQQRQYLQQQQQSNSQWQCGPPISPSPFYVPSPPTQSSWPLLIQANRTPSPLFAALLDAIFTLSLQADTSNQLDVLTPTRLAAVYDELGYPPQDNLPFLLHRQAQTSFAGDTKPHVNEAMKLAWQIFELEFFDGVHPGLTRKGFQDMMVRDALIYPVGQATAWNNMVGKHRGALMARGLVLPAVGAMMGAEVFMPPGVAPTGDVQVQMRYKERRERWVTEYKMRFGGGGGSGAANMDQGMDFGMAMRMENWKHRMTMDAMTPGYRVTNGSGGYDYVYTGGLNW